MIHKGYLPLEQTASFPSTHTNTRTPRWLDLHHTSLPGRLLVEQRDSIIQQSWLFPFRERKTDASYKKIISLVAPAFTVLFHFD